MKIMPLLLFMVFSLLFYPAASFAEEEEELKISIQEAVENALRINKELQRADLEKDQAWEDRKGAQDQLRDRYPELTPEVEEEIDITHTALIMAELDYQIKAKQKEALEEDVKAQVVEKYTAVLAAQEKVKEEEHLLEKAEWEYEAAQIRRDTGMLSSTELTMASQEVQSQRTALAQAEKDLEKAYTELNVLIGLWPERRPQLVTDIHFRPMEVRSIISEVNRAVDSSHDLELASKYAQLQRLEMRRALQEDPYLRGADARAKRETERDVRELEVDEAEQELKKQVRLMIYDIHSLEDAIASAEESLKAAEESKRAVQARYDVGFAARGDLLEAKAAVSTAEHLIADLKYRHASLTAAYRNLTGRAIIPASW